MHRSTYAFPDETARFSAVPTRPWRAAVNGPSTIRHRDIRAGDLGRRPFLEHHVGYVARAFLGIGNGLIWPCVMGLCVTVAGEKKSGTAISLMVGAVALGNVAAPVSIGC